MSFIFLLCPLFGGSFIDIFYIAIILLYYYIVDFSPVVIWSDGVGDLHLWEDPVLWYSSHGSPEGTAERTDTGET